MLLLIGLGCILLILAFCGMVGFVTRCIIAITASAMLVRCIPSLSHEAFAWGQVGFSWLFLITIVLTWITYKIVK